MNEEDINKIVKLRTDLITEYSKLRDYKRNEKAIMFEKQHASVIHATIVRIDNIIGKYVNFKD
jgi:hypothetical protein